MKDTEATEMTVKEAKPLVEKFIKKHLKTHECVYPSDVADNLRLEYGLVMELFDILEKEEKICKKCE